MLSHSVAVGYHSWFSLSGPEQDVVLSSRVRLERNLSGFLFYHRLDDEGKMKLRRHIETVFSQLDERFVVVDGDTVSDDVFRCYRERGILHVDDRTAVALVSEAEDRVIRIGPHEHVSHESYAGGLDLFGAFDRATEFDQRLENRLDFAVSLDRGYLSSDVMNAGTGLSASLMVHLPGLYQTGALPVVISDLDSGVVTLHQYGAQEQSMAHLYAVSVPPQTGRGERELLMELEAYGQALVHYERAARADVFSAHRSDLAEAAHRALGTLRHARRIDLNEALELIDLLRFVVASGEDVEGLSIKAIDALLFHVQPGQVAVLSRTEGDTLDSEEEKRAALVRQSLNRYFAQGD